MIQWAINIYSGHPSTVVIVGYITPFVMNAFEFTLRTIREYREDLTNRSKADTAKAEYKIKVAEYDSKDQRASYPRSPEDYRPSLKLGHIIARLLGIVTPFINFFIFLRNLDKVFELIGQGFKWLGKFFDIALVPKR